MFAFYTLKNNPHIRSCSRT